MKFIMRVFPYGVTFNFFYNKRLWLGKLRNVVAKEESVLVSPLIETSCTFIRQVDETEEKTDERQVERKVRVKIKIKCVSKEQSPFFF